MKNICSALFLTIILSLVFGDLFPQKMGNAYRFYINNINLPVNQIGALAEVNIPDPDPIISGSGGKIDGIVFLFAGGFFLSGIDNSELWANAVAPASLLQDYVAGLNNASTDPRAQLYRIKRTDTAFGASWLDWVDAVALGADYYDGDGNGMYNPVDMNGNGKWDNNEDCPDLLGDETVWCVFHDGLPASQRRWNTINPKGIEIRQTVFAYSNITSLENIIFIRYKILNTGAVANILDSVYFGIWDDADLGNAVDDLVGCDIGLGSQFTYNDGPDDEFGNNPPTFLVKLLAGPHSYIPGVTFIDVNANSLFDAGIDSPLDTAFYNQGEALGTKYYPGAKNLDPISAINYRGGDPFIKEPNTAEEARNYMLGQSVNGQPVDPCLWPYSNVLGGVSCSTLNNKLWYSGDPVTQVGWIHTADGDNRQLLNMGPFKLEAGKPVEILAAYVVGRGTDALSSVTLAKNISNAALDLYNANFDTNSVVGIEEHFTDRSNLNFQLSQNYPNPFNPSTSIQYALNSPQFVTLKVYDALGTEVVTLVSEEKAAGEYRVEFNPASSIKNPASSIYFYRLQAGNFSETKKMILMK
jgi:hypothetical protein